MIYTLTLFWSSLSLAQCPTINSQPPIICDAAGLTFSDLDSYVTTQGNGIVWYDSPTGGLPYNSNELLLEGTFYAGDTTGNCGTRPAITVDFQVDPSGQNLDAIYCSNENPTFQHYIDDVLTPNLPSGGSVEVYSDSGLTNMVNPSDGIPMGATGYFVVFIDTGGCRSQIELGNTAVFGAPADPTPPSAQAFCSSDNPLVGDLDPGTTATINWFDNIDGSGNPIPPALSLTSPLVNSNTYYVQITDIFCDSNPVPVTVTIDDPFDAGTSATLEYCNDNLPTADFNLFDQLAGTPDTNGVWSGPLATSNGHLGTVNISSLVTANDYVFTYTIVNNNACPNSIATVTIRVYAELSSGTVSPLSPATFCEVGLPSNFDLFSLLDNEDAGGIWVQGTNDTDPQVGSPLDLTGFTPGTYDFTYFQNLLPNLCNNQSTTVQITVLADPNAGLAINAIFCENDLASNSPYDLFNALDGSQDNNSGTWTDTNGVTVTNPIDISGFSLLGSPYEFTYTVGNGTCTDSETITITVEDAPESGTVNGSPEFCEGEAPSSFDLFDLLDGEDQAGVWYAGSDNTGSTVANPIDLSGFTSGTYDFTYDVNAIGNCDDVLVTVSIVINPLPNTGIATALTLCENELAANSPLDLFGQLSGNDLGGTWADDSGSGALTGNTVDLTALAIGSYDFTYSITDTNNCSNSTTVTITVEDAPESGTVNGSPEFCEGEAPLSFDLFDLLDGEDQAGVWYAGSDNTGSTVTNPIDLSGFTSGTYDFTYDVNAIGNCDDVLVTVSIVINPLPNTGIATPLTLCENELAANSPLDLFGQLSGNDLGGTWADDSGSGALTGNTVDLTALAIGSYDFTYSITDTNNCSNSTTVTITVEDAPESGTANPPLEICIVDITAGQTQDLFDLLDGEDQTGIWSDDDGSGALVGSTVTVDGLATGTYNFTYDVNAIGNCDDILVTVSIIIQDIPEPSGAAIQEFCDAATIADLIVTGQGIQWYDSLTSTTPLDGTTPLIDGQTYYATQTDQVTNCESSNRLAVAVVINISPNSGNPSTNPLVVCNDNNNVDLNTGLDGTQDAGGVWIDTDATGALTGNIFDATGLPVGSYDFEYFIAGTSPCPDASTIISVTIEAPLNPGSDNILDICTDEATVDLFTLLGGADTGGTWSPALNSNTGVFDPAVDTSGTYTYTLQSACGTFNSDIVVTVTSAPNAGGNNSVSVCTIDGLIDLTTQLTGTPDTNGTWFPALASGTNIFDPTLDTSGTYTYTVLAVSPCASDAIAELTITVNDSNPPTVIEPNPAFCRVDNPVVSDLNNFVSATGTVNWYSDNTLTTPLLGTEPLVDGEDYFATQTNTTGCESSQSVALTVNVNDSPTPSLISPLNELCINDAPTIADLTLNILEFDASTDNVLWYEEDQGGSPLSASDLLVPNITYYAVLVDPISGCESSVRLAYTPDLTACGALNFPDGFSPNGDGVNDTFDIDNLDVLVPDFEMEIYNRYGNLIYKGNASSPRFNGKSNQSGSIDGDLPVGVYFYIFKYNNGINKPIQGSLYLSR